MNLNYSIVEDHSSGFITKRDRSQLPLGAMKEGSENIVITDGDRIGLRRGRVLFGQSSTATTPITSSHTHRRRDSIEVQLRAYSTLVEYYHSGTAQWETLKSGFTSGRRFGFADFDRSADATAHARFGNGVQDDQRWNGQFTQLNGALVGGEATITVDSTTGFTATGSIIINGTTVTYTGITVTTFTGCVGTPAAADNSGVAQLPVAFPANAKGNIYEVYQNRLCIANVTLAPNAVFISKVDNDTDFTFSSPRIDGEGAIINVSLGAGNITALINHEQKLYVGKQTGFHTVEFLQFDNNNTDFPFLVPVSADENNPFLGPQSSKSVFVALQDVYFASAQGGIKRANRLEAIDDPLELSDRIRPTVNRADFADAAAILFDNKGYISARENDGDPANNIVFVYNFERKAWEAPIKGWNVSSWNIAQGLLFGHSSLGPVTHQYLTDETADVEGANRFGYKGLFKSGDLNFGTRVLRKKCSGFYVEGFIAENTTVTCRLVYEFEGQKGTKEFTIEGDDTDFILASVNNGPISVLPLAVAPLASGSSTIQNLNKFRVYFTTNLKPFYEISVEFESEGVDQDWEILAWGINAEVIPQIDISLQKND